MIRTGPASCKGNMVILLQLLLRQKHISTETACTYVQACGAPKRAPGSGHASSVWRQGTADPQSCRQAADGTP